MQNEKYAERLPAYAFAARTVKKINVISFFIFRGWKVKLTKKSAGKIERSDGRSF